MILGSAASLLSSACWALGSVWFERLTRTTGVLLLNALTCVLGLALFGLTQLVLGRPPWPAGLEGAALGWLALSALVGLVAGDSAFFATLRTLGTRRTVTLTLLWPPVAALLGWAALGEPLDGRVLLGMGLTLAGLWLVIAEPAPQGEAPLGRRALVFGLAWALTTALCQAGGSVLTRYGGHGLGALDVSVVRLVVAVVALLPVLVSPQGRSAMTALSRQPGAPVDLALATVIGTWGCIGLMNAGLLYAPVAVATTLNSLAPVFMLPIGAVWLKQRVTLRAAVGAVVATVGSVVLLLR